MIYQLLFLLVAMAAPQSATATNQFSAHGTATLEAQNATINAERAEIVGQKSFATGKGVSLKYGITGNVSKIDSVPDLSFSVQVPRAGRYWIYTHAATDATGRELMRKAKGKHDSMFMMITVDNDRPTKRVIFVPWRSSKSCRQKLGKFSFNGKKQLIKIWIPAGVRLDNLKIAPYKAPKIPKTVDDYQPSIIPPASHPRVWVNKASLPIVRANLEHSENRPYWEQIKKTAEQSFKFNFDPNKEAKMNPELEKVAMSKAFVYLMTHDKRQGLEAVKLTRDYLSVVEFGNIVDVSREIGKAIYSASLVYDWCYDLMTSEDRTIIRQNMLRLADDMEIGWPPFKQLIVNGHGNEAQLNRNLLSMAIAIYDEYPLPYRYCAYRILEELVPMRKFEYQSPRHSQGANYGPYRFKWDMHAAWLFYRMTGKAVFDDNIANVYRGWLYLRLPNGKILQDGDGRKANLGVTTLLSYAYSKDPVIKHNFKLQGISKDPLLMLLLNEPKLKATANFNSLPLTIDYGPIIGGMIARTGWTFGEKSDDVVVEMKGGGYQFGNHQHADAGSFQIYYRGLQAGDLGQYKFYATPYDYNFNKRSIAHCMMLAVDPNEKFSRNSANDGGTRFVRPCPRSSQHVKTDKQFANGKVVSTAFGPLSQKPLFSYFSVNLSSAYSNKIKNYVRTFCFLNLKNSQNPAVLIILDNMTTAQAEFKKYWQVNTLNLPETSLNGVILRNSAFGKQGKVNVNMLRPKATERKMQILSGKTAYSVFGQAVASPRPANPEAKGHRVLFSPIKARTNDIFLTVLSMSAEQAPELPVALVEQPDIFIITITDRVVVLSKTGKLLSKAFNLNLTSEHKQQLLLTGLAPGPWSIRNHDGKIKLNAQVKTGHNTAFVILPAGNFTITPSAIKDAAKIQATLRH